MNKTRILGILLLLSGSALFMLYDHDFIDFAFGFMLTVGTVLTIFGSLKNKYKI